MKRTRFITLDSTNEYIKREDSIGEYHIVYADEQSAGRGRRGNKWSSSKGGAWFSFCLSEDANITQEMYGKLPFVASVSVSEALREVLGEDVFKLKWVNDVYVSDKKICGILIEKSEKRFIIGIGININNEIEMEYTDSRTSLKEIAGKSFDIEEIIVKVAELFYEKYSYLIRGNWGELYSYICERDFLKGKEITVFNDEKRVEGIAQGITIDGRLIISTKDETVFLETGSVILKK